MFTGIIEHTAQVHQIFPTAAGFRVEINNVLSDLQCGESIAVNGVCLTLLSTEEPFLCFDISPETAAVTTLATLASGDWVHLERAMQGNSRFGGHYVSGHVDCKAQIVEKRVTGEYLELIIDHFTVRNAALYLLSKASITIDGISLTINSVAGTRVSVMLIPHTQVVTALPQKKPTDAVNIEFDYITRIVAHQLQLMNQLQNEVHV